MKKIITMILWFITACLYAYDYQLSICAIFKNEAPYLKEWIDFHRKLGVKHFWLFNNQSNDHYKKVLRPYIKKGIVELIEWNFSYQNPQQWCSIQCEAYNHAIKLSKNKTKWLIVVDIDEFIFPIEKSTLLSFLDDFEDQVGVSANWQMYGTSFIKKLKKKKLLVKQLFFKTEQDSFVNRHVKTIVRPEYVLNFTNPHYPNFKNNLPQVNENKETFFGPFSPYISINKIRINHYWTRDENHFFKIKIPKKEKRLPAEILKKMAETLNKVYDNSILQCLKKIKQNKKNKTN